MSVVRLCASCEPSRPASLEKAEEKVENQETVEPVGAITTPASEVDTLDDIVIHTRSSLDEDAIKASGVVSGNDKEDVVSKEELPVELKAVDEKISQFRRSILVLAKADSQS